MNPRRGDIWLIDFGQTVGREQRGRRPGVIVSTDALNEGPAELTFAVPMTTVTRGLPTHVAFEPNGTGLDKTSYAKCEDLKSISQERLIHRLGETDPAGMRRIEVAIKVLLDL